MKSMTEFVQSSAMLKLVCIIVFGVVMIMLGATFVYLVYMDKIQTALEISGILTLGLGMISNVLGVHLGASTSASVASAVNQQANITQANLLANNKGVTP
jgi:hypothetical protein